LLLRVIATSRDAHTGQFRRRRAASPARIEHDTRTLLQDLRVAADDQHRVLDVARNERDDSIPRGRRTTPPMRESDERGA